MTYQRAVYKWNFLLIPAVLTALYFVLAFAVPQAHSAQLTVSAESANSFGSGFTYQGQLADGGAPANGSYDFKFQFLGFNADGTLLTPVSIEFIQSDIVVTNGFFETEIDAGASLFNGEARFLQVSVRPVGEEAFVSMGATEVRPTPYAIYASKAAEAETLSNLGDTVVQAAHFAMIQSDGQSDVTFSARGNGRLEVTRSGGTGTEFLYVPVDVPSSVLGYQQKLKTLSFCYSGDANDQIGVLAGIHQVGVREMNRMDRNVLVSETYDPSPLTGTDECVNISADNPEPVRGSVWIRFKVTASPVPLQFGEIKLTFVSE